MKEREKMQERGKGGWKKTGRERGGQERKKGGRKEKEEAGEREGR